MRGAGPFLEHMHTFLPVSTIQQMLHEARASGSRPSTFRITTSHLQQEDIYTVLGSIAKEITDLPRSSRGTAVSSSSTAVTFLRSPWFTTAYSPLLDRPLLKSEIQSLTAVKRGEVYFQVGVSIRN